MSSDEADTKSSFLSVPWISSILSQPNTTLYVSPSRSPKSSLEDSLYAETLKTPRTLRSCLCAYAYAPDSTSEHVDAVSVFVSLGDGMNGFPKILHGGITATLIDECMGMFQTIDAIVGHAARVKMGKAEGELPPKGVSSFTVELKVKYLRQVRAPGYLVVVVKQIKAEGRKRWLAAELRQCVDEGEEGELVTCATGEALFIEPKGSKL